MQQIVIYGQSYLLTKNLNIMKKLFTLFVAALFCATMFADTKTVYCQVTYNWWTHGEDFEGGCPSAAVAVHYWGGASAGTEWPGVRMTAVVGENGVWTCDIPSDVTGFCFVRVNNCDPIADWGAKTVDLSLQDDKNMFVIADEEHWGDDKCVGSWEVFVPAKFFITGILGSWTPNAIKSTENSYVVENVPAGHHAMKVTNGTWDVVKGLADISESSKYLYPDQDGNVCFSLSEAADVTVTYIAGEPETFTVSSTKFTVPSVKLVGDGEAFGNWDENNAIVFTDNNEESASHTFTLAAGQHVIFKMIRGGDWLTKVGDGNTNYGLNSGWTSASDFARPENESTPSLELSADLAGDYTFTWTYATGTLTVTFPEPVLENGFYLVGEFNGTPAWTASDLTAAKKFTWNKHVGEDNEEWVVTADLQVGDVFKAAYVYRDATTEYIPADEDIKYLVDADHDGNDCTIYFQQKYNEEWGGHFWVVAGEPTAVDEINANDKAIKRVVNGQLLIIRDGKTFNALGIQL